MVFIRLNIIISKALLNIPTSKKAKSTFLLIQGKFVFIKKENEE
jgi:hypothetical protein